MPQKVPQPFPRIRVSVDVHHTAAQTRLQLRIVVLKQVHDARPRHRGKNGPRVMADAGAVVGLGNARQAVPGLDGQARECQYHARKDVDDDLLVDARDLALSRSLAEDDVAAKEAGEETVIWTWISQRGIGQLKCSGAPSQRGFWHGWLLCIPSLPGDVP